MEQTTIFECEKAEIEKKVYAKMHKSKHQFSKRIRLRWVRKYRYYLISYRSNVQNFDASIHLVRVPMLVADGLYIFVTFPNIGTAEKPISLKKNFQKHKDTRRN